MSYTPPPQAAQRPRRTLPTVLIVVGIVLAVCCVGGIAGGFWLYRTVQDSAGPAEDATKVYIDDVLKGARVSSSRTAEVATVTVAGTSLSVIPGWSLSVRQSATVPVERITR